MMENADEIFGNYGELPLEVQTLLDQFVERKSFYNDEYDKYDNCQQLKNDLEEIGYTCEYDLDGIPYCVVEI